MMLPDDWYRDMGIILPEPEPGLTRVDPTEFLPIESGPEPMTTAEIMGLELPPDADRGQLLTESSSGMLVPQQAQIMITDGDPFFFHQMVTFTGLTSAQIIMALMTQYRVNWSVLPSPATPYPLAVMPPQVLGYDYVPPPEEDVEDADGYAYWVGDNENAYCWKADRDEVPQV
jgi:hypothetical protein